MSMGLGAFSSSLCSSLEDLALVEILTHVLKFSLPEKVLFYHSFTLLAVRIQLAPLIRFVVNSPVRRQLKQKNKTYMQQLFKFLRNFALAQ